MKTVFDVAWQDWIRTNVQRGCSLDELYRILIDEGFEPGAVRGALNHAPGIDVSLIVNPLRPEARTAVRLDGARAPTSASVVNLRRIDTLVVEIYTADAFLSGEECAAISALMKTELRDSTITVPDERDPLFRVSKTCDLGCLRADAVARMDARICQALGTTEAYAEQTQGQHYDVGGEFKPHTDYFEAHELERFSTPTLGQRSWTFMVYLNEPEAGGETTFVKAGLTIRPRTGLAVIWNNLLPDGCPNPGSLHHGTPVRAGHKDIITKWFRVGRERNSSGC